MHTEGVDEALGASYRLVEKLGRGATGEVWKAVDRRNDEVVAAKLLRQEPPPTRTWSDGTSASARS